MAQDDSANLEEAIKVLKVGDKVSATAIVIEALKANPDLENAWVILSYLVDEQDKKRYALNQALRINPQNKKARDLFSKLDARPQPVELEASPQAVPAKPKYDQENALLEEVASYLKAKDIAAARVLLERILQENPECAQAWYLVSFVMKTYSGRVAALQRTLKLDPNHIEAKSRLATIQVESAQKNPSPIPVPKKQKIDGQALSSIAKRGTKVKTVSAKDDLAENKLERLFASIDIQVVLRTAKFLLSKALLIAVTIFIGVFITVLIVNQSGQMDQQINQQIDRYLRSIRNEQQYAGLSDQEQQQVFEDIRAEMEEDLGLNLPFWPRHALWTVNAMKLDWGKMMIANVRPMYLSSRQGIVIRDVLLDHLPNTVLLAGAANFLVFVLGIPLALYLARKYGNIWDKAFSWLTPLSSIPSWVIGIILISIFAVELRILPTGGMFGNLPPPETALGYVSLVSKHMVLPVMAIFISLFFQLVYSWRTFFIIYAAEDYVELGIAKGLPTKLLENKYILRPAISYIITNFAVTLIGFWQMTMALEVIFDWPGIGWLYVEEALPNFWGLSMYPGELLAAVGVVVIFAYLLGFVVFLLDFIYVLVDPRITVADIGSTMQLNSMWSRPRIRFSGRLRFGMVVEKFARDATRKKDSVFKKTRTVTPKQGLEFISKSWRKLKGALIEIRRYPSAIAGLVIISALVIGSIYAIVALPYQEIGSAWSRESLTGAPRIPKLAGPAWINIFRRNDYLSVITLDSQREGDHVNKTVADLENGMRSITLNYTYDYSYADFPQELYLYLSPTYRVKKPFVSLVWITPDGREFELKGASFGVGGNYDFAENIPYKRLVRANQHWLEWFNFDDIYPTPPHYVLFADPESDQAELIQGTYQLVVNGLFFEPEGDLDTEFLLLGNVYGLAGTDYLRRDLIVPLLWGMPFALLFGLFGATLTTLVSMIVAATGVWFGGRVDDLIQRITEVNMVLPILAISVLAYAYLGIDIWVILTVIILLNVFGSPTKTYRAAFLQFRQAPYVEAAYAYGASNRRIIFRYLVPRIIPVLVPQLITLIPSFVFLEATLGIFNIKSNYPTWGTIIYQGLTKGALYGSRYWVLQPLTLLLLTGISFSMLGAALDRILNPRLLDKA